MNLHLHFRLVRNALFCTLLSTGLPASVSSAGQPSPQMPTGHALPIALEDYVAPEFADISVHDPSVIRVDDVFYIFGSHLSAAKTQDWVRWERVADLATVHNPLFNNVFVELAETFRWAQTNTLWAADVTRLKDGRFYFYYNACRGDSPRSALGVAVADTVDGPYEDLGVILRSGMWGQISEDGQRVYDATIHPNTVDPHVFYDQEGKLWMVYGSYSGGIFILEMDETTGKPYPDQGYGKHLTGGNHQRIEAPYILHSPHTGYYYLFLTFGGLDSTGGYNMRVARSTHPNGPYFDSRGNNMTDARSATAFNDTAMAPFGVKLMGNFVWETEIEGATSGYVSPGHCTAYYEERSGRYFLIFHTRFPSQGEFHQVRVHEMFMNEEGWPVVSPLRFAPRVTDLAGDEGKATAFEGSLSEVDEPGDRDGPAMLVENIAPEWIPGSYRFIHHGRNNSADMKHSRPLILGSDGTLSGAYSGMWYPKEHNRVQLDLLGLGTFHGVFSVQWNELNGAFTIVFTALSDGGASVWGVRWHD